MKNQLRETLIQKRNSKDSKWIKETSQIICERLYELFPLEEANTIALYYPFNQEVSVLPLIERLLAEHKKVVLPKVIDRTTMNFYAIASIEDVETSSFGVKEPVADEIVKPNTIDWMIIPGVGFTPGCYRLGYGAGYYDRYLTSQMINTIGVAFDFQITDGFSPDPHDVPLDYVITESRLLQRHSEDGSSNRNKDS